MKVIAFFLAILLFVSPGLGQKRRKKPKDKPEKKPAVTSVDALQNEIGRDTYIYDPKGRRDPFKSLLQGKETSTSREALEGIAGLTIGELTLEGIVGYGKDQYKALLKGPDNRPYTVTVGEKVYDGKIKAITPNAVIFTQELTVALGGAKQREVIKYLNPEEEASKR